MHAQQGNGGQKIAQSSQWELYQSAAHGAHLAGSSVEVAFAGVEQHQVVICIGFPPACQTGVRSSLKVQSQSSTTFHSPACPPCPHRQHNLRPHSDWYVPPAHSFKSMSAQCEKAPLPGPVHLSRSASSCVTACCAAKTNTKSRPGILCRIHVCRMRMRRSVWLETDWMPTRATHGWLSWHLEDRTVLAESPMRSSMMTALSSALDDAAARCKSSANVQLRHRNLTTSMTINIKLRPGNRFSKVPGSFPHLCCARHSEPWYGAWPAAFTFKQCA